MSRIKTGTIALLIMLIIVQLSNIWNINVNDIFESSYDIVVTREEMKDILIPSEAYIEVSEGVYQVAYSTNENKNALKSSINIIESVLENGEFLSTNTGDREIFNEYEVLYKYYINIDKNLLSDVLDIKSKVYSDQNINFDEIYMDTVEGLVCFYNSKNSTYWEFKAQNLKLPVDLKYNTNIAFTYGDDERSYFVPFVIDEYYYEISETNPYSVNGEVLASTVENQVNRFFKTPTDKWTVFGEDSYIFSGEEITVNYSKQNILEYNNNVNSKRKVGQAESYAIAKSFIKQDNLVKNDISLKKVEGQENSYTFYFNPIVNNTEVVFDNELIDYYITIEVSNGIVKYYQKYGMNYDIKTTETQTLNKNLELLTIDNTYDFIEIVYLQDMDNLSVVLAWAMTYDEEKVYNLAN